jgi:lipid II:glycine glycyltransferase (peptidoglycan interpeptide bridge formation enzyme)
VNIISTWNNCIDAIQWDCNLANVGGHPLQSALWGNARQEIDGIQSMLFSCQSERKNLNGMARVELRKAPLGTKVAWMPRGPFLGDADHCDAMNSLQSELRHRGFIACISDPYSESQTHKLGQPRTIWIDLTVGLDALSKALDAQWRYGARRALREGVVVRKTRASADVSGFYKMCNTLSEGKGFALPGTEALMQELIRSSPVDGPVKVTLYVGEVGGAMAGGALIATCGAHIHYLWGASDRSFSKYRVSEAVQWQVIQDGVAGGMTLYDLEGIDPVGNPGVYEFKRKMGGREVSLQGMEVTPLSILGRVAVSVGRRMGRLG